MASSVHFTVLTVHLDTWTEKGDPCINPRGGNGTISVLLCVARARFFRMAPHSILFDEK